MSGHSILTPGVNYLRANLFSIETKMLAIQHSCDLRLEKQD